ncbi:MAG: hypothetical protein K8J08_20115 [Thermoanaerobaculia bacterium]|nr:hypothetical protein [Thermoanaerobaculia bacterium]
MNFLRPEPAEILRLIPEVSGRLPKPQKIFLSDETASPMYGFPVLLTESLKSLGVALHEFLRAEEELQVRMLQRQSHDQVVHQNAWENYRRQLARATDNVTTSSAGRQYPDIFWLLHSLDVARVLKGTPGRVTRIDSKIGRERGGEIKYSVFFKFLDRVLALTYDSVHRLAQDTEEVEQELFPTLLGRMRDNVLIFTEDHISRDLSELTTYFQDNLHIDGRDLRYRLAKLNEWHNQRFPVDPQLNLGAKSLLRVETSDPAALLRCSGYVTFLATCEGYNPDRLLGREQVQVWERLLLKLKEFELYHGLRRLIVPLEESDGEYYFRDKTLNRTWVGPPLTKVSNATRPLDFMAPWVVDPQVSRFGMIYDITDFSHTVTVLRRAGTEVQDSSFRQMFRFQRRVNRFAATYRLKLEKYLGDGAFYSAREAWRMLVVAIEIQRLYRKALDEGFPFDRGLRIALNHGNYRLLPIQGGAGGGADRFEFFGHGVVELTRLTTGKSMREIEEIKILLIGLGYREEHVHEFFNPLISKAADVVDKDEETRPFHAYLNQSGKLINEGIVATAEYIEAIDRDAGINSLYQVRDASRRYVGFSLDIAEHRLYIGIRKLGKASLKGLDPVAVYEVVDGSIWKDQRFVTLEDTSLVSALDRMYAKGVGG